MNFKEEQLLLTSQTLQERSFFFWKRQERKKKASKGRKWNKLTRTVSIKWKIHIFSELKISTSFFLKNLFLYSLEHIYETMHMQQKVNTSNMYLTYTKTITCSHLNLSHTFLRSQILFPLSYCKGETEKSGPWKSGSWTWSPFPLKGKCQAKEALAAKIGTVGYHLKLQSGANTRIITNVNILKIKCVKSKH